MLGATAISSEPIATTEPVATSTRREPNARTATPASGIKKAIATFNSSTVTATLEIEASKSSAIAAIATVTEVLTTVPARPAKTSSAARNGYGSRGDAAGPVGGISEDVRSCARCLRSRACS